MFSLSRQAGTGVLPGTGTSSLIISGGNRGKMDIAQAIREIESQVGRISPVQKFLLGTDGSVTQLLESVTGKKVVIRTLVQRIEPADRQTADNLSIAEGDPVNYRIVEIRTGDTGNVLIYAISHTPLSRLSPEFRDDLMKADIPIGRIIQQHKILVFVLALAIFKQNFTA